MAIKALAALTAGAVPSHGPLCVRGFGAPLGLLGGRHVDRVGASDVTRRAGFVSDRCKVMEASLVGQALVGDGPCCGVDLVADVTGDLLREVRVVREAQVFERDRLLLWQDDACLVHLLVELRVVAVAGRALAD